MPAAVSDKPFIDSDPSEAFRADPAAPDEGRLIRDIVRAARQTRSPEQQRARDTGAASELLYRIREPIGDALAHRISRLTVGEALDVVQQCQALGAEGIAAGRWANFAVDQILDALKIVHQNDRRPLVRYAARLTLERLGAEFGSPTLSVFKIPGDRSDARIVERYTSEERSEAETLRLRFWFSTVDDAWIPLRVAKDAVAVYDHAQIPRSLAQLDWEHLPREGRYDIAALRNIQLISQSAKLDAVLDCFSLAVLPALGLETSAAQAERLYRAAPDLNAAQWQNWLEYREAAREFRDKVHAREGLLREQAENEQLELSHNLIGLVKELAPVILEQEQYRDDEELQQTYLRITAEEEAGHLERTYEHSITFIRLLHRYNLELSGKPYILPEDCSPEARRLAETLDGLEEKRQAIRERYREQELSYWREARAKLPPTPPGLVEEVGAHHREIRQDLYEEICRVIEEERQARPEPALIDYRDIAQYPALCPFLLPDDQELALLLQHLHRPAMRSVIEQDLNIDLRNVPLRSQIHFLRYLSRQDDQGFHRLQTILRKQAANAEKIACAFLANAEDELYCDVILALAEQLRPADAERVFSKYLEITEATEDVRRMLARFPLRGDEERRAAEAAGNLLKKANQLLQDWSEEVAGRPVEALLEQLGRINVELLLFGSTCKAVAREQEVDFTAIEDTSIGLLQGPELPAELKEQMTAIARKNNEQYPACLQPIVEKELLQSFDNPQASFYYLTHQGQLISFLRFVPRGPDTLYFGSFNTEPSATGLALGGLFLDQVLRHTGNEYALEAMCHAKTPFLNQYLKRYGFQVMQHWDNYENMGEEVFKLRRPKSEDQLAGLA